MLDCTCRPLDAVHALVSADSNPSPNTSTAEPGELVNETAPTTIDTRTRILAGNRRLLTGISSLND